MSLFNWFNTKSLPATPLEPENPAKRSGHRLAADPLRAKSGTPTSATSAAIQKIERHENRELLYNVVHNAMICAGVLAATYKFKVLSLDTRGFDYLIMMDLTSASPGDTTRLAEIEATMAQAAKARHNIVVTAVYWRVNEVSAPSQLAPAQRPERPEPPAKQNPVYEPLQQGEIDAFKRALAGAAVPVAAVKSGHVTTSGRRNPTPVDDFEDTHLTDSHDSASPLSMTQYGDLN